MPHSDVRPDAREHRERNSPTSANRATQQSLAGDAIGTQLYVQRDDVARNGDAVIPAQTLCILGSCGSTTKLARVVSLPPLRCT